METATIEAVLERLETLEREKRQVLWVVSTLFVAVLLVTSLGTNLFGRTREAEAERFVVKDRQGRVRVELGTDATGEPVLAFRDAQGREQISLAGYDGSNGSLSFFENGQLRMELATATDGRAAMDFYDTSGRSKAGLFLWPDSTVGLNLRSGEQTVEVAAQPNGLAGVSVADSEGRIHGKLGLLPDSVAVRGATRSAYQPPFRLIEPGHTPDGTKVSEVFHPQPQALTPSLVPTAFSPIEPASHD